MLVKLAILAASLLVWGSAASAAVNLVPNGDFELGNTGFTSAYTYSSASNTDEGQYTVRTDPYPWNSNFGSVGDHTSGSGMMMVANGAPVADQIVWQSAPIVIAGATDYFFEAFVMNVCCNANYTGANSAPILSFSISLDGGPAIVLDTLTIPLSPAGVWYGLSTNFNSGPATLATLFLVNANTERGGNDFAVDDISLSTESTVNGVPEPGTWMMMLLGFGAIGVSMRYRRPRTLAKA
jgi:hypothetical protein